MGLKTPFPWPLCDFSTGAAPQKPASSGPWQDQGLADCDRDEGKDLYQEKNIRIYILDIKIGTKKIIFACFSSRLIEAGVIDNIYIIIESMLSSVSERWSN